MHVRAAFDVSGWNGSVNSYTITALAKYGARAAFELDIAPFVYAKGDMSQTEHDAIKSVCGGAEKK